MLPRFSFDYYRIFKVGFNIFIRHDNFYKNTHKEKHKEKMSSKLVGLHWMFKEMTILLQAFQQIIRIILHYIYQVIIICRFGVIFKYLNIENNPIGVETFDLLFNFVFIIKIDFYYLFFLSLARSPSSYCFYLLLSSLITLYILKKKLLES